MSVRQSANTPTESPKINEKPTEANEELVEEGAHGQVKKADLYGGPQK